MKVTLTLGLTLLPAALAHPSYGHGHSHAYKAYKSGYHYSSGAALPSGSATGPYSVTNDTASQAAAIANAESSLSTAYLTLFNTIYQTASDSGLSEAAATGTCGGTTTVTSANTVYVTVAGSEAESATAVTPDTQAPVAPSSAAPVSPAPVKTSAAPVVAAPVETSPVVKPVAPISQSSVPVAEKVATPSAEATSSTAAVAESSASPSAQVATPKSDTAAAAPPGGKRGLFIPVSADSTQADYVTAFNNAPGKISWIVNQFSGPPPGLSSSFDYVPQCYDKFSDESKPNEAPHPWTTNAEKALATGTEKFFLSFGEPNTNNSQNFYMDAEEGAQNFMTMLQPYATQDGVTVGSPGTLGAPLDIQWQKDFLEACAGLGCKIGWVSAHWFSPCGSATAQELADTFWGTINTYKQIAQTYSSKYGVDLKVWVDNFSLNCIAQTQIDFFNIVIPQLEADDMIARYGYVSTTDSSQPNGFINADGSMSALGQHYATM